MNNLRGIHAGQSLIDDIRPHNKSPRQKRRGDLLCVVREEKPRA